MKKISAAEHIFKIPYLHLVSESELYAGNRLGGADLLISNITNEDTIRRIAAQQTLTSLTIAQAAEMAACGSRIGLSDPKNDATPIYRIINEHLNDWYNYCNKVGLMTRPVPLDDLKCLNSYARDLVRVARRHGLVNLRADYEQRIQRRAVRMGTVPMSEKKDYIHTDSTINAIATMVTKKGLKTIKNDFMGGILGG